MLSSRAHHPRSHPCVLKGIVAGVFVDASDPLAFRKEDRNKEKIDRPSCSFSRENNRLRALQPGLSLRGTTHPGVSPLK